jgi:4-hydroxythreonine-4-phosphate dehydrogenase
MKKFVFTCGDINGIGPEIVIKTINKVYHPDNSKIYFLCPSNIFDLTSKIVAPSFPYKIEKKFSEYKSNNVIILDFDKAKQTLGQPSKQSGSISYKAIKISFNLAIKEKIDAIITSPISKTAFKLAGIKFPGHTEAYADWCKVKDFMMMFLSQEFKCGLITIHEPIRKLQHIITEKRIRKSIGTAVKSLHNDFCILNPAIAVLGINPHAGENGNIGKEEIKIIKPAIDKSEYKEFCSGPFVPDAFFANKLYNKFDFVIGMYHDQLLIPFKLLNFHSGVNYTAGLPIVRTSPDHGTAFDIAGQGIANESSMSDAFFWADKISDFRKRNEK